MKATKLVCAMVACSAAVGCSNVATKEDGSIGKQTEALNGTLTTGGNLTRKGGALSQDEATRQLDTDAYYAAVKIGANGTSGASVAAGLPTLSAFKSYYGFAAGETVAYYYNRGDLGIGREMHCVDSFSTNGQIACYVKNFAAGRDNSEFTFGFSSNIAFTNMAAQNSFATVAMVYRNGAAPNDKVFFAVYRADENLTNAAALDRHGLNFANAFNGVSNPPAQFGVPGQNFNNHIPSNCMSCHGGQYSGPTNHPGSVFLPFDLDQFEYQNLPGRTRADQLTAFENLNQMVRTVANNSGTSVGPNVRDQIDIWYGGGDFDSTVTPGGWDDNADDIAVYHAVVRPLCRSCHVASVIPFNTAPSFYNLSTSIVTDLCQFNMPHALQTVREFWLSAAPSALENYLRSKGKVAEADQLRACRPGTVVTLDPHLIVASIL